MSDAAVASRDAIYDIAVHVAENTLRKSNRPNAAHLETIRALIASMTDMAVGKLTGRWAFPIPTGLGKSVSAKALIRGIVAYNRSNTDNMLSVTVASSKVEELCKMYRELISEGVSPLMVGLTHSKRFDAALVDRIIAGDPDVPEDFASVEASAHPERCPVLLVTHARVKGFGRNDTARFADFNGRPRNLLIFDETLITTNATGLQITGARAAAAYIRNRWPASEKHQQAADYLDRCLAILEPMRQRAKADPTITDNVVDLPPLDSDDQVDHLVSACRGQHLAEGATLIRLAGQRVRVFHTSAGGAAYFTPSVDPKLKNICILDASHPVRTLMQADRTINDASKRGLLPASLSDAKRYRNVTLKFQKRPGGKGSIVESFSTTREDRKVSREIVDAVKSIPENEAILIFTHKAEVETADVRYGRKLRRSLRQMIRDDLEAAGVDMDAKITINGKLRPRISLSTFGNEAGSNAWSHCHHVMLAGVMYRSHEDLGAHYFGLKQNLGAKMPKGHLSELELSEAAHVAYQAGSRGRMRNVVDGEAEAMTLWIMAAHVDLIRRLREVMPDIGLSPWGPTTGPVEGAKADTLAMEIGQHLTGRPELRSISTRKLKADMGVKVTSKAWTRAVAAFLGTSGCEWHQQGRSLIRAAALFEAA